MWVGLSVGDTADLDPTPNAGCATEHEASHATARAPQKLNVRAAAAGMMMAVLRVVPAGTTHPFGDHRSVDQAFPAAIPSAESDP